MNKTILDHGLAFKKCGEGDNACNCAGPTECGYNLLCMVDKKVLHLTLKKKWFDMIASGEKKEEYREIKPYWFKRFTQEYPYIGERHRFYKKFDAVTFTNGYSKNAPKLTIEFLGVEKGKAKPEWSDNWQGEVFIIKLGKILWKRNF